MDEAGVLETSAEVAPVEPAEVVEQAVSLDVPQEIFDALDSISDSIDSGNEEIAQLLSGLLAVDVFTLAVLLVILGALLFAVFSVAVRRV